MTTCRAPLTPRLAVVLLVAGLASCASPAARPRSERGVSERSACSERAPIVLSSAGWLNGDLETPPADLAPRCAGARAASSNVALRPNDPWLGTVGVRGALSNSSEMGMGLCVPNPFPGNAAASVDRPRDVGLGVWLRFDF